MEPEHSRLIALSVASLGLLLKRMKPLMKSGTSSRRTWWWVPVFSDVLSLLSMLAKLSSSSAELIALVPGFVHFSRRGECILDMRETPFWHYSR